MRKNFFNEIALRYNKKLKTTTVLIVLTPFFTIACLLALKVSGLMPIFSEIVFKAKFHMVNPHPGCLLFLGMTLISIFFSMRKQWIVAALFFTLGVVWLTFHPSVLLLIKDLGVDSLDEVRNFNSNEARFLMSTLKQSIHLSFSFKVIFLYAFCISFIFLLIYIFLKKFHFLRRIYMYLSLFSGIVILSVGTYDGIANLIYLASNSNETYSITKKNFGSLKVPKLSYQNKPLTIVMYIGESTTSLNMGLYGYFRDTTPSLSRLKRNDENLIVFNNVLSTHTHTSPSLLEALSFGSNNAENFLPINQRKRIPVADILYNGNVEIKVYSNQERSGTYDLMSSLIFRNATFFVKSKRLNDESPYRPYDDEFFFKSVSTDSIVSDNKKTLMIFHSYAGHGPYLENIPESFRAPVDNLISTKTAESIIGKNRSELRTIDDYDSAIKYIDHSVSASLDFVKKQSKPTIFIYFPDHGESVYTDRGHNSARFIHEMVRIPFLMYFNQAAKKVYPEQFEKYKLLSSQKHLSTLTQLPSTILDLFGIKIASQESSIMVTPTIGKKTIHSPIVVRETIDGISYINLNAAPYNNQFAKGKQLKDHNDGNAKFFSSIFANNRDVYNCYHRSNSIGKALRGSVSTNCLEVDIVARKDQTIGVYHPPAPDIGLNLTEILSIANNQSCALWLDGKNLQSRKSCEALLKALKKSNNVSPLILIEFPAKAYSTIGQIAKCITDMKKNGYITSYYVPTSDAIACTNAINVGKKFMHEKSCVFLRDKLEKVAASKLFTDLSFDYAGLKAIEQIEVSESFRWNIWNIPNVKSKISESIKLERLRMVILENDDPNDV